MLLAKLSMDIEAKHTKNGIAKWSKNDIKEKLWPISPLSTMWGIGPRMEKKLNNLGIQTIGDLACYDSFLLKKKFGIIGHELWCHANGIDDAVISQFHHMPKEKSFSHSQVLFKDYYEEGILLILREMVEVLGMRLRENHFETSCISISISYSKTVGSGFSHSTRLSCPTDLISDITAICMNLFESYYDGTSPIRKVSISFGGLTKSTGLQLNLFHSLKNQEQEEKIQDAIQEVKKKFGKNSLNHASSLLSYSTILSRNEKVGGHHE